MSPDVTDHAVIRYIERVLGMDVDDVRNRIRNICKSAAGVGARAIQHEGFSYKLSRDGRSVVSVTPIQPSNRRARK